MIVQLLVLCLWFGLLQVITSQWQCGFYCSCVCVHNNEILLAKILGGLSPHLQNIGGTSAPPAPPSYAPVIERLQNPAYS